MEIRARRREIFPRAGGKRAFQMEDGPVCAPEYASDERTEGKSGWEERLFLNRGRSRGMPFSVSASEPEAPEIPEMPEVSEVPEPSGASVLFVFFFLLRKRGVTGVPQIPHMTNQSGISAPHILHVMRNTP